MTNRARLITSATTIALVIATVLAFATCETSVSPAGENPRASRTTSTLGDGPIASGAATGGRTDDSQEDDTSPGSASDGSSAGAATSASTGTSTAAVTGSTAGGTSGSARSATTGSSGVGSSGSVTSGSTGGPSGGSASGSTTAESTSSGLTAGGSSTGATGSSEDPSQFEGWTVFQRNFTIHRTQTVADDGAVALAQGDDPRVSPDGTKLSFVSRDSHDYTYEIINADGSGSLDVASYTWTYSQADVTYRGFDGTARWSPDSSRVAYALPKEECDGSGLCVANPDSGVWVANADGSGTRRVSISGLHPVWSPDSSQIGFVRDATLMIVSANGMVERPVYQSPGRLLGRPSFSPDGKQLAFLDYSSLDYSFNVRVVGTDSLGARVVAADLEPFYVREPQWSPDGRMLAFADFSKAFVVNADGSDLTIVGYTGNTSVAASSAAQAATFEPAFRPAGGPGTAIYRSDPSWSPSGDWLVICGVHPTETSRTRYAVQPDGTTFVTLAVDGICESPIWVG